MLMRRWERARQGDGQFVLIVSEPGLGKSRLIEPSLAHDPRRRKLDDAQSTTFTVSLEGITDTEAAGPHKFCTSASPPNTSSPLPFCGHRGRSLRVSGRRGRAYGVGTYAGLHQRDRELGIAFARRVPGGGKSDLEGAVAGASEALRH
jgi:hypothetical protein